MILQHQHSTTSAFSIVRASFGSLRGTCCQWLLLKPAGWHWWSWIASLLDLSSFKERGKSHLEPSQGCKVAAAMLSRWTWPKFHHWHATSERECCHCGESNHPDCQAEASDSIPQVAEHSSVKITCDSLSTRNKLLVNHSFTIKKTISIHFTRDLLMRAFLGFGNEVVCHSELCHFNWGS